MFQRDVRNRNVGLRDHAMFNKPRVSIRIREQSFHYATPNI